jgi:hypothetical protein
LRELILVSKKDLDFLSREFENFEVPKEKRFLLKYFKQEVQQAFLRYYLVFGSYNNFVDHTGFYCQERWLKVLHKKLVELERVHKLFKSNIDLESLLLVESGNYKL